MNSLSTTDQLEFVLTYVDDLLFIGPQKCTSDRKALLSAKYEFRDLGPASKFIGLHILQNRPNCQLCLDQTPYVMDILGEFQLLDATPVSIPINPKEN